MSSCGTSGPTAFHDVLAGVDPPMVVVTCAGEDGPTGCLVGFATQCSIKPPRYLACISKKNHTYAAASSASVVAVHVLDDADRRLAEIFGELSGDSIDKLSLVDWHNGPDDVPVIDDAAGWFAGRVVDRVDLGDHTGLVLEPFDGERRRTRPQLGYQEVKDLDPGHAP